MAFSTISKKLTIELSKLDKKDQGIYFTPPSCVAKTLELINIYMPNIYSILEPSCGSCEYICALQNKYPQKSIVGIEYNETIFKQIQHLSTTESNTEIVCGDFLTMASQEGQSFDLIIGNPPYYVMKKELVDPLYYDYFEGRPNIFILFIIKSLKLLSEGGILSFVLPKSFLNCLYYDKTRKFIMDNYQILHIVDCNDKYIETQQKTILLIVRNIGNIDNTEFIMKLSNYTIFTTNENKQIIHQLYSNSRSLGDLGFNVRVGNIVWNQCKSELTSDDTKTRLIYSSDIKDGQLISKPFKNIDKQQYINRPGITRPMIVVNRGYGVGTYNFSFCLLNTNMEYLIENHLICIEYENENELISSEDLLDKYNKIIESFNDERTCQFIENYFGNSAINTNELKYIMPIYC